MGTQVNISSITGTSPYNIWVCAVCGLNENCVFITTTDKDNITFILPYEFENLTGFCVKINDSYGCIRCECFGNSVSPTPSMRILLFPDPEVTARVYLLSMYGDLKWGWPSFMLKGSPASIILN